VWSDELFMEADSLPAGADLENMCCTLLSESVDE